MTSWFWFVLNMKVRGHDLLCTPYWYVLGYTIIFLSLNFASLRTEFLNTMDLSVFLPSDKLLEVQVLAHSLLQTQPFIVPSGHLFFRQGQFLCQQTCTTLPIVLFHSEWHVECLPFSSSFFSFNLSFPALHQHQSLSQLEQGPVPLQFFSCRCGYYYDAIPSHWTFYY